MPWSGTTTHPENSDADDLRWVRSALGGDPAHPFVRSPYLARPSATDPQLLVPLQPRAVTRAAMHRVHDARSWPQRLAGLGAQAVARVGLLPLAGGERIALAPFPLVTHLANVLGEPELVPVISIGPRRRNRKPVVQLVRPDGVVVGFAKIAWSPFTVSLISNEAHWLRQVEGRLPPGLRAPVVLVHERHEQDGESTEVVVTSPVPTPLRSHRKGPLDTQLLTQLARCLGSETCTVAESGIVDGWRPHIGDVVDLDLLLSGIGNESVEIGLWHGDLTPWNTATSKPALSAQPVTSAWDWEFADDRRPVGFDALHLAFETVRRAQNEQLAIDAVVRQAPELLASVPGGLGTSNAQAVIDLYLCEILAREARLRGEGWEPEHLGPIEALLTQAISGRLRRFLSKPPTA